VEKLQRECKNKDDQIKNLKKKLKEMNTTEMQRHKQHFRISNGEGVPNFFKVRYDVLVSLSGYHRFENIY
jgi:hypothetical protein